MDRAPLTTKQRQTLEALCRFADEAGYQPSLRELADLLGLRSASTVHARLQRLEDAGWIRRVEGRPRSIEL